MNVLMIGLGDHILTEPEGEVRRRHERYAARAGHLTVIVYSKARGPLPGGPLSASLAAYAARGARAAFLLRAVWLGLRHARRPVHLVTTQDPFITGLGGVILARLLGAPLLVQNHSSFFDNPYWLAEHRWRNRFFNRLGKWVVRRATMNRVVNPAERAKYLALGLPPERVRVVPMGNSGPFAAPLPPERIAAQRAAWGLGASHRVVLWVGHPARVKRLPALLDVMQRVVAEEPEARLVLVGDLSAGEEDIPAEVARRGLEDCVIMPGPVPFDALPAVYQAADVFALTSAYEGMPRVFSEAAASGLPFVAMDIAALRGVIRDGENGYLLPQGDVAGFAARVVGLLREPERARAMGARGRAWALEHLDSERLLEAWMALWEETARGG